MRPLIIAGITAALAVSLAQPALAAAPKHPVRPTLRVNHAAIVHTDAVTLRGKAQGRAVLYRNTGGGWRRLRTVHDRFKVTERPGRTTRYRVSQVHTNSAAVKVAVAPDTCGTWPGRMSGVWGLSDSGDYTRSALFTATDKLVCSAAEGATINIRMYFVVMGGAAGTASGILRNDLWLMHHYHGVRVNVLVQANGGSAWWGYSARLMPWAHFYVCVHGCQSGTASSKAHSKWITVSRMQHGSGTGVLTLSANLSNQQFQNWEDGVLSIGNTRLYDAVQAQWDSDVRCSLASVRHCGKTSAVGSWQDTSDPQTQVYFAPISNDLIQAELEQVDCTQGGTIYYASLGMARYHIRQEFIRLQAEGCTLNLVIEHPSIAYTDLAPLTHGEHDKLLVVRTPSTNLVISGSECFTPGGVSTSDNVMLRLTQPAVVATYTAYARKLWATSRYAAPVAPAVANAAAAQAALTDS